MTSRYSLITLLSIDKILIGYHGCSYLEFDEPRLKISLAEIDGLSKCTHAVHLPKDISLKKLKAKVKNGLLTITIPKKDDTLGFEVEGE